MEDGRISQKENDSMRSHQKRNRQRKDKPKNKKTIDENTEKIKDILLEEEPENDSMRSHQKRNRQRKDKPKNKKTINENTEKIKDILLEEEPVQEKAVTKNFYKNNRNKRANIKKAEFLQGIEDSLKSVKLENEIKTNEHAERAAKGSDQAGPAKTDKSSQKPDEQKYETVVSKASKSRKAKKTHNNTEEVCLSNMKPKEEKPKKLGYGKRPEPQKSKPVATKANSKAIKEKRVGRIPYPYQPSKGNPVDQKLIIVKKESKVIKILVNEERRLLKHQTPTQYAAQPTVNHDVT